MQQTNKPTHRSISEEVSKLQSELAEAIAIAIAKSKTLEDQIEYYQDLLTQKDLRIQGLEVKLIENAEKFEDGAARIAEVQTKLNRVGDAMKSLEKRDAWLSCLESAGVDNWQGYDYASDIWNDSGYGDLYD